MSVLLLLCGLSLEIATGERADDDDEADAANVSSGDISQKPTKRFV